MSIRTTAALCAALAASGFAATASAACRTDINITNETGGDIKVVGVHSQREGRSGAKRKSLTQAIQLSDGQIYTKSNNLFYRGKNKFFRVRVVFRKSEMKNGKSVWGGRIESGWSSLGACGDGHGVIVR